MQSPSPITSKGSSFFEAVSGRRAWPFFGTFATLFTLWFVLCRHLSGEWSLNEQYNYGWFVPFFALYLFWLRWERRPEVRSQPPAQRGLRPGGTSEGSLRPRGAYAPAGSQVFVAVLICIAALLLMLPIRLFEIGNPEWRPLGWIHTAAVVALTLTFAWYVGGGHWLRYFAFPVAFFFVAVPWVTPIEAPIIQGLMRIIASMATETANVLGIPAQLQGNLIRLPTGTVGVNEACSGVRSLQTSLMIGLLFGELKRLSILRRIALVAGAVVIALITNFARSVFLVWIAATKGISDVIRWHDVAGYLIVALVFAGSLALAAWFSRNKVERGTETSNQKSEIRLPTSYFLISVLLWLIAVEVVSHWWYWSRERNLVANTVWTVQWPGSAPNFREIKIDQEARRALRFDEGQAASWNLATGSSDAARPPNSNRIVCSMFLFRWKPARNSALLANLHRPDVCLPAVGWQQLADNGVSDYPITTSFVLPFRHFEFRAGAQEAPVHQFAHAFYCLWEDRKTSTSGGMNPPLPQMATSPSSWTRQERVRVVLEGRRNLGQQMMELVFISRQKLDLNEAETRFAELVRDLVVVKPRSAGTDR